MLLLTGNINKYNLFKEQLDKLSIKIVKSDFDIPELQEDSFEKVLENKAKWAYEYSKISYLVDDTALFLDAYDNFPGVYTKFIIKTLGKDGLNALLHNKSKKATLKCKIGCWYNNKLYHVEGSIRGELNFSSEIIDKNSPGPLSTWFIPSEETKFGALEHRFRALNKLEELIKEIEMVNK